jgi:SAM-dependent methyltransferase
MSIDDHVAEDPLYRQPIRSTVEAFSRSLAAGSEVLDAGAGNAPFRPLFAHCRYRTIDWPSSVHPGARRADVIADLTDVPLPDASADTILCTEVLEHVFDAPRVLTELHRLLRPGGRLLLTVPFVIGLHEPPYDFARYTSFGLEHLARNAGLDVNRISPLSGSFSAVGAALRHALRDTVLARSGEHRIRAAVVGFGLILSDRLMMRLDRADHARTLPLGWALEARAPGD